jgi:hypothetical protein
MFRADKDFKIQQPISQYFASQLINLEWVQPGNGEHRLYRAESDIEDAASHKMVTAYAVQRPDGQFALMLINRDQMNPHPVHIVFSGGQEERYLSGAVTTVTFGSEQYQWHPAENGGNADPDGPAARSTVNAEKGTVFTLPKASMTVIRGKVAGK